MSRNETILGMDDRMQAYMRSGAILAKSTEVSEDMMTEFFKEKKKEDKYNQEVVAQMYMLEIMIDNMKEEYYFHLGGIYSSSIIDGMEQLRLAIVDVNKKWEDFRKSFGL